MKKWIIIGLLVLMAGGITYHFFSRKNGAAPVPVVKVKKGDVTEKAEAVGYIKPLHSITIKSQIDGTVQTLYHDEGERVTTREPLIAVKPAPKPADYASTYQALQTAQEKEKLAAQAYQRYDSALQSGLITRNYTDYINAKQLYETSKLDTELAAQKLALLQKGNINVGGKAIGNIVVSPIDGYILKRNVDVGDPVISLSSAQAATALFTVANMHDLMFEGTVDEMDASKIHVGMPASIVVGSMPGKAITGRLSLVSLQSATTDANSPFNVGFDIKVTDLHIPEDLTLRSGYSATASIKLKSAKDVLVLPERVIHFGADKTYVMLPEKDADGQYKEQQVTLGLSDGVQVEIVSGLKEGDKVLDAQSSDDNGK